MKKICIKIGAINNLRQVWAQDLSKLYYFKKRATPKLQKYVDSDSDYSDESSPQIMLSVRLD